MKYAKRKRNKMPNSSKSKGRCDGTCNPFNRPVGYKLSKAKRAENLKFFFTEDPFATDKYLNFI